MRISQLAFLIALAASVSSAALAGDTTVTLANDGTVVGEAFIPAAPDDVRRFIADPHSTASLDPDVLDTKVKPQGPCLEITRKTRGMWSPLTMRSLRCPTKTAFAETLLESDDFSNYKATWDVPQSMVRKSLKNNVHRTIDALLVRLLPGRR
jgi:hypothetical protein